ncbi:MAG TPA: EboA domain-containing protein, partial [Bacteroidia bacterium]|nr:EboA domain-containing protein [Bacteroidia bacterium]
MQKKAIEFILTVIVSKVDTDTYAEIKYACDEVAQNADKLKTCYVKALRRYNKQKITYTQKQLSEANSICNGWLPPLTLVDAVRTLLLLHTKFSDTQMQLSNLQSMVDCGDNNEQIVIYQNLALLPHADTLALFCAQGLRSNMADIFEAIANNNPYPAKYLADDAFNQMVLKCVFIGKPLYKIVGLHQRLNPNLSRMIIDYAAERWAASRSLSPEVWQLTPIIENAHKDLYLKLQRSNIESEQKAAS